MLLTLHVLFPTILLPALDVLDRQLVTRLCVIQDGGPNQEIQHARNEDALKPTSVLTPANSQTNSSQPIVGEQRKHRLYIVRSAASAGPRRHRRPRDRDPGDTASAALSVMKAYNVHLDSWNCPCPGFALNAFTAFASPSKDTAHGTDERAPHITDAEKRFGGMALEDHVPCCKHLLACLLAEQWHQTGQKRLYTEQQVSKQELAGIIALL